MSRECVLDVFGCVVCPQILAAPAMPERVEYRPIRSWSSGANSELVLYDDNVRVRFSVDQAVGVICGLSRYPRVIPSDPTSIHYGIYCFTSPSGATLLAQAIERGALVGAAVTRAADAVFEVRRVAGLVSYRVDEVTIYTSLVPSTGGLVVGSSLYASGDTIL